MAGGKKGAGQQESKKSEMKKKEKIIEDKTFGLKNKNKSKTVQSFVKGVTTQVLNQDKRVILLVAYIIHLPLLTYRPYPTYRILSIDYKSGYLD